jgi:pimeloyl-ACP methyl ester carboxylesterase
MKIRFAPFALAALVLTGCAPYSAAPPKNPAVTENLREARVKVVSAEERAARYLVAAAEAAPKIGPGTAESASRETYNTAASELAVLLRGTDNGRLWNRPLTLSTAGRTYNLRFQPGNRQGLWAPDYFTALVPAREVPDKSIKHRDVQEGIGGALVGVRKKDPREPFAPLVGVTGPVTATLDFHGHDAVLALRDPTKQPKAPVAGATRPLAADFSAPLAYYPAVNETIAGLMGALRVSDYMSTTGMYMLEPYDPDKIPVIFVHGLISTARMWRNVVNEIEMDPELRRRYQCWVFAYPTGNPVAYSALRFREELTKAEKLHGFPHGFVLVSHSMGGIVSRMQATTLDAAAWDRGAPSPAEKALVSLPPDTLIHRSIIFNANPNVRRIVFICTPHRGSNMAVGGLGEFAMRLIALPANITSTIAKGTANSLAAVTGSKRLPNSIYSLSPENPTLKVMDKVPIQAPYHTILGDRGRGDSPNSSDGVVPYWSSHLDPALSQKIVPGPHGSCELPQTIEELKRILHLHLKTAGR